MVFEKVCEILAEQFAVDAKSISEETSFIDDLHADSLDLVELMMSIEDSFDVGEIEEENAAKIETVGELVELIQERTGEE